MPLMYRYNGFKFFIHSNDHKPPHVHVKKAGIEIKVEYYVSGGYERQKQIPISTAKYSPSEASDIADFTREYRKDIIAKCDEFFSKGIAPKNELIHRIRKKKTINGNK